VRFHSIGLLFKILNHFINKKSAFSTIIYKTITFSLIENHAHFGMRSLILYNAKYIFETVPSVPIDILLEPLIR